MTASIDPGLDQVAPLGHQDPAWRPDGTDQLAYVRSDRDGAKGTPRIYLYDTEHEEDEADHRARLPPPVVVARRQVHHRDEDVGVSGRTS